VDTINVTVRQLDAVTVIKVAGELDLMTADTLSRRTREVCRPGDQVIFDLTETTFLDCSGLRSLLRTHEHMRRLGGAVRLSGLQPGPAKIIAISQTDRCLPVHECLEQAMTVATAAAAGGDPDGVESGTR
jgi:anti-sigma B factor antagonist